MLNMIFDINTFNVYSDNMYYYFFRALNMPDNNDIESGITTNENGEILRIRTNLERYEDTPMYTPDDELSLEQIFNHIKMHQRKDTNCISLTSNANTAITYGRGNYKDRYVMLKISKSDINNTVYEAGLYMLEQINEHLNSMIQNNELTEEQISILGEIDKISSQRELDVLKSRLITNKNPDMSMFEKGLERITTSTNYLSLNDRQNLEKNKIVLKLDVINKNLLKGVSNNILIQTIGNAFSSLELIHYRDINREKIIEIPKEIMDILGLIQQLPSSIPNIDRFKAEVLSKVQNIRLNGSYEYEDFKPDDDAFSIDNIYNLTEGKVSYYTACEMYKKAFYYAKSKIRTYNSINLLKKIMNENPEYESIFKYMEEHTYGIEPEITTRISGNKIQVSESVSLDFLQEEKSLFEYLTKLNVGQLNYIMNKQAETLKILLNNFIDEELDITLQDKEDWYANSIIDMLDLERLGVSNNLSLTQRKDIVDALKANNFYEKYLFLKNNKFSNKDIANLIFTSLIRNTNEVSLNNLFSLEELEYFIGYNRVSGTKIKLRSYQKTAVENIDRLFADRQFASVVLPTGAGKSFVALAEMYKYSDQKILYLAPNVEILNQIKGYIRKVYKPEEHIGDKEIDPIKRMFPNIVFDTYQHLGQESAEAIINDNYSLIIFDELHRTGAKEWKTRVEKLLDNQDKNVRVLGITATPERDVDFKDMTDYWAQYYGYSDEEIVTGKHMAINMDLVEAIRLGYVINPRVVNCEYSLLSDGTLENMKLSIDDIKNESLKGELSNEYERLRRNVEKSDGIEKILSDNLSSDGKYIVFLPVTKKDGNTYEDEDGNKIDNETAKGMIASYKALIKQYMFSSEYFNQYGELIINIYNKINLNEQLSDNELMFLQQEKENILLLSEMHIKNKPTSLSTKNNMMINTIINYLGWEMLSEIELTKKLNIKMRDKIEDYTMLGSFSDKKNKSNLDSFNNDKSKKVKFMFVMNKLNEGVHVNDIDGIIWLRPLSSTSKILYLQQLGRCIYSINPNVPLDENKRPLVLDFVNNTLKVKLEDRILQESIDLNKLRLIKSWIDVNQTYPKFDSSDGVEREYAITLNNIHKKYNKYITEQELLNDIKVEKRLLIQSILEEGEQIDLWNGPIFKIEQEKRDSNSKRSDEILGVLKLSAKTRDFIDLEDKLYNIEFESKIIELIQWFKDNKRSPKGLNSRSDDKGDCFKDGKNIYNFLLIHYDKIINGDYPELLQLIERYYPSYNSELSFKEFEFEKHVKELIQWFKDNQRSPQKSDCFEDGNKIYAFLGNNKSKIINGDYSELLELIEKYYLPYNSELSMNEIKFEKHINELIQWFKDNQRRAKRARNDDKGDCFEDGKNIGEFLKSHQSKIINGDYPELLGQIEMYYPEYNSELSKFEIDFVKHVNELIQWFKDNKRAPKPANLQSDDKGDCFEDGGNILYFLRNQKSRIINGNYPELLELIEKYYSEHNSELSMNEMKFEKHVYELIQWFKENKRPPKGAQLNHKGDCFEDGVNIYDFINRGSRKSKIMNGDYFELLELIEKYYPEYNSELSMNEIKFEKHINELIQWFKDNKRTPKGAYGDNEGDCFEGGRNIHEFLNDKKIKNKIVNGNYPELLEQIKLYYPRYTMTGNDLKLAKIEEIFLKYSNSNIKISVGLKDSFEIDNTLIGNFLNNQKPFIFEQAKDNPHARWIIEQMSKWKKEYEAAAQAFAEVSEFSRVMTKMEGKVNETGIHKLN